MNNLIEKLEWIIFYFEGTCEFCLGNIGIDKYRKEIDGYLQKLDDFSDDIRLRIFYASAVIEYKLDKYDTAYEHWQKALSYAKIVDDSLYIAKIYSYLAIYYYFKKNRPQEEYYFKEAEHIFKDNQQYGELATHYINILWFKRYETDTREVIEYMDKALYYVQLSDSKKNARVYLHLGYIHKTIFNDFIQAIEHLIKSIELSRENGFVEMESMTMNVLADGYSKIDKFNETVNIYTSIMQNDKYKSITANLKAAVLCSLISCYLKMHDTENAEKFLLELERILPEVQVNIWERYYAVMLGLKAELYCIQGDHLNSALELVLESEQIYIKNKSNFIMDEFDIITANRIGDIYFGLRDFSQAIHYYNVMNELIPRDNLYYKKTVSEHLAKTYEAMGDDEAALLHYKECNRYLRELRKKKIELRYETLHKHFMKDSKEKEIGKLNALNSSLEEDTNIDGLTGLYNRNYLNEYIESRQSDTNLDTNISLLMVDIDSFKAYNDNYGHDKGDEVLRRVAAMLKNSCIGWTEKVVRYGGEEFLIILEQSSRSDVIEFANAILHNMESENIEHNFSGVEPFLTVSIGIATCISGAHCNILKVIEAADQALFYSKRNGKNMLTHVDSLFECINQGC